MFVVFWALLDPVLGLRYRQNDGHHSHHHKDPSADRNGHSDRHRDRDEGKDRHSHKHKDINPRIKQLWRCLAIFCVIFMENMFKL